MSAVKFFTDEDVFGPVAAALRRAGVDAISTPEAGRLGASDEEQLEWAVREGRAIISFNVAHFAALHNRWMKDARHHSGIVVSSQRPIGDLLRRLNHMAKQLDAESLTDRLEYLSDW